MDIHHLNTPLSSKSPTGGIVIAACGVLDGKPTIWYDKKPELQTPLWLGDDGTIDVQVNHMGGNNVFRFTQNSVTRLSHVGPLLDLTWWNIVPLGQDEGHNPILWPQGARVVGTPWILKDPYAKTEVGFEADAVFEDITQKTVEEQWEESFIARFKELSQNGPLVTVSIKAIELKVKQEEKVVTSCFGLFQGDFGVIRFWEDHNAAITWGTVKYRRHLLKWNGDVSTGTGKSHFTLRCEDEAVEVATVLSIEYPTIGGNIGRPSGSERLAALAGTRGLSVSQYMRAMAEMEARSYHRSVDRVSMQYPKPRTSKRSVFGKR